MSFIQSYKGYVAHQKNPQNKSCSEYTTKWDGSASEMGFQDSGRDVANLGKSGPKSKLSA